MDIRRREVEGVTLLELGGRFTAADEPGRLKDAVAEAVKNGARQVVLDLSSVHYIDSTRLGELISAHITLSRHGGRLVLASTPTRIAELLALAGLDGIFERHATVAGAVGALTPLRPPS
jgi:anti-sigma B factor antagonist